MTAFRVGLTGGLASGKSTVADLLRRAGFTVLDADEIVADLYRSGEPGARAVEELFGPAALDDSGAVAHRAVAALVFDDPEARRRLEKAIHPLVRERFAALAEEAEGVVVLEATLLVEAGYADAFDTIVTVEADREVRLARAIARGLSPSEARARLRAQGDGAIRLAAADHVVTNDGSLAELEDRVAELIGSWEARLNERAESERDAS